MIKLINKIKIVLTLITCVFSSYGQNYYEDGYKQYLAGQVEASIKSLTKAIENNQELAKSYMYRGAAKTFLGKYVEALDDIKASLKLDSTYYKTYFYCGRVYFAQGFFSTAIKYYDITISKNNKDADIYDDRAIAKLYEKNHLGAIADEDTAIKINSSNSSYYVNRGFIKLELKQYKEAIKDFNKALSIKDNPKVYSNRGVAFAAINMHKEAINDYTKAIDKMLKAKDLFYHRGLSYRALGKSTEACLDFTKSVEMGYQPALIEQKKDCFDK